ncbi:hypothetical protein EASAB2608_00865 [Streptomyces sp. EAS-AB2608]|nr:hypothetical protein EASAB2608_00865 [Streptomyces sp. EAS-AB2608]
MLDERVEQDLAAAAQIGTADPFVAREAVVRGRGHGSIGPGGRGPRRVVVTRKGARDDPQGTPGALCPVGAARGRPMPRKEAPGTR